MSLHRFSHEAMATVFEIHCDHADARYAGQAAVEAFALVDRLEQQLSRFVGNSDVSRVNALAAGEATRVSPWTLECLEIALRMHEVTGGAFDVSLGSGLEGLELDPEEFAVRAGADGIRVDLGGIGKGYAVDRVAELLEEWGIPRALVHGGFSSVRALDAPADADGWALALRAPGPGDTPVLARLSAVQRSLSASGTQKGAHIRDPRSGSPAPSRRGLGGACRRPRRRRLRPRSRRRCRPPSCCSPRTRSRRCAGAPPASRPGSCWTRPSRGARGSGCCTSGAEKTPAPRPTGSPAARPKWG